MDGQLAGAPPDDGAVADLVGRYPALEACRGAIAAALATIGDALEAGGTPLVCGNGGSAADSEHLVADLVKGFLVDRPIPERLRRELVRLDGEEGARLGARLQGGLRAIALPASGTFVTAMGNDVGFDLVFAQQVLSLGRPGDVLLTISTSGASPDVIQAARVGRAMGIAVVALTGRGGGRLADLADVAIRVPADRVHTVQELHVPVYHALAMGLEQRFFGGDR